MMLIEFDVQIAEDYCRERRQQAAIYRLLQAQQQAPTASPSMFNRLQSVLARLHLIRSFSGPAKATA